MELNKFDLTAQQCEISETDARHGLIDSMCYRWADGDEEVACVNVEKWAQEWTACNGLHVASRYRGRGLSHQIVEFLISVGVNHLSVDPDNQIARHLYERHGFRISGEYEGELLRMVR